MFWVNKSIQGWQCGQLSSSVFTNAWFTLDSLLCHTKCRLWNPWNVLLNELSGFASRKPVCSCEIQFSFLQAYTLKFDIFSTLMWHQSLSYFSVFMFGDVSNIKTEYFQIHQNSSMNSIREVPNCCKPKKKISCSTNSIYYHQSKTP